MERKRRTYKHKGKIRFKRRLPRKKKKELKKKDKIWEIKRDLYTKKLKELYGDDWWKHIIIGG